MKCSAIILTLAVCILCSFAYAGTNGEIVLTDGSVVSGEIRSVADGVYTIQSSTLGLLKIHQSKIREIRFGSHGEDRQISGDMPKMDMNSALQGIQKSLLGDKEIIGIIQALQGDPQFQKILNDPNVMNSVMAGDVQSLMANPEFLKILDHPKMKEIQSKMAK
jgi:hypothetical protein